MLEVLKERRQALLVQLEDLYYENYQNGSDIWDSYGEIEQSIARIDVLIDFMRTKKICLCEKCGALLLSSEFYMMCETCWDREIDMLSNF